MSYPPGPPDAQLCLSGGWVVEEWSLFNEFDVLAQLLRDDSVELSPTRP